MGLFKKQDIIFENISSVVILEQTQNYSKSKAKAGLVFGGSILNPDVVFMDGNNEPTGCTYTFSVTYKDGKKDIIKADSGTGTCDRLLQLAMDIPIETAEATKQERAPELKKNQLPQGIYTIGKDIPPGTYDFHLIWGNGRLEVYKAEETILGNLSFGEWVGNKQEYEKTDCISVRCDDGWFLHITGNIIIEIERSNKVIVDL